MYIFCVLSIKYSLLVGDGFLKWQVRVQSLLLEYRRLVYPVGIDKLAHRARTQILTDDTQITGTPNYGVPSQIKKKMLLIEDW